MRTAVVTGGASGIGRALAAALVDRGVHVTVADLDGAGAERVAAELTGRATGRATEGAGGEPARQAAGRAGDGSATGVAVGVALDVTDAAAVADVMRSIKAEHGHLDMVFNNAGIGVGGRTEELTLDHWNRAIDVNLRGVVHGVHAAYPIMVEQGSGHIVNTASLAGLTPAPLMAPYTTTKHAVVGLSLSLRAEAACRGVKVSAVCPAFVDTAILDNTNPGLPQTEVAKSARETALRVQRRLYTAEGVAADVLRGMERDKALIVVPAVGRFAWRAVRWFPSLAIRMAGREAARLRREAPGG